MGRIYISRGSLHMQRCARHPLAGIGIDADSRQCSFADSPQSRQPCAVTDSHKRVAARTSHTPHPHQLLPLLPSRPDGVRNLAMWGDRDGPPLNLNGRKDICKCCAGHAEREVDCTRLSQQLLRVADAKRNHKHGLIPGNPPHG